jgi:hypothetical protein
MITIATSKGASGLLMSASKIARAAMTHYAINSIYGHPHHCYGNIAAITYPLQLLADNNGIVCGVANKSIDVLVRLFATFCLLFARFLRASKSLWQKDESTFCAFCTPTRRARE